VGEERKSGFSHLDAAGRARMVDVSEKAVTRREAEASCRVRLSAETVGRLETLPKGDAYSVSRLAGIQAAKRAADLVPLAHPLPLDHVEVSLEPDGDGILITTRVVVQARTGAEIEAMAGCAGAALALYDMVKALERGATITDWRLERKSGGRSGTFRRGS
jgi:cyclic pyranopterin phosphate synthase